AGLPVARRNRGAVQRRLTSNMAAPGARRVRRAWPRSLPDTGLERERYHPHRALGPTLRRVQHEHSPRSSVGGDSRSMSNNISLGAIYYLEEFLLGLSHIW